jgi:hypothetical protein
MKIEQLKILYNEIDKYTKEFSKPNHIKINLKTLKKLEGCVLVPDFKDRIIATTILGLIVEIDNKLKDNTCIIYDDICIYRRINLK